MTQINIVSVEQDGQDGLRGTCIVDHLLCKKDVFGGMLFT